MGSESVWKCTNTKSVGKRIILGHDTVFYAGALYCIKTPMPDGVWIVSEEGVWIESECTWGCVNTKSVGKNV